MHIRLRIRPIITRFIILSLMGLLAGCVRDSNLREGIRNFQEQDYRQAFIRLKPVAEQGYPQAEYAVGYMYYYGQGVVEDRDAARYWITAAARAGQPDARTALSILEKTTK